MLKLALMGSFLLIESLISVPANAEDSCNTALGRIGRKATDKAIVEHQNDACSGLKTTVLGVTLGLDDTKQLELRNYKLCEAGPIVTATLTVHVQCSTGSKAAVPVSISDDLTTTASANLDTCQILDLKVTGGKEIVQAGLDLGKVSEKLRDGAQNQISPY